MVKLAPLNDYNREKYKLQSEWRPKILTRDNWQCCVCGIKVDEKGLDLAHITPCRDFLDVNGQLNEIKYSYREDNLFTFCRQCHELQHGEVDFVWDDETRRLVNHKLGDLLPKPKVKEMYKILQDGKAVHGHKDGHRVARINALLKDADVREFLDVTEKIDAKEAVAKAEAQRRLTKIKELFAVAVSKRGWTHAAQVMPNTPSIAAKPVRKIGPTEIMNMTRRWIEAGYIPSRKCAHPGDEPQWQLYLRQQCTAGPSGCSGDIEWCPDCCVTYCGFHGPKHRTP